MLKKITAGIVFLGLFAYAQNCNNPQGVYSSYISIALALATETGRWQPLTDLKIEGDKIAITDAARERCANRFGNCANTLSALKMQNDEVAPYFDPNVFNPVIYRQRLVIQYLRQQIAAMRPETDPNRAWAPPYTLTEDRSEWLDENSCSHHVIYDVASDSSVAVTPENLCSQLIFAGSQGMMVNGVCIADNPYLDMRILPGGNGEFQVAIDPDYSPINWGKEALSPDDARGCVYIDQTGSALGLSCVCSGVNGVLQPIANNPEIFSCR